MEPLAGERRLAIGSTSSPACWYAAASTTCCAPWSTSDNAIKYAHSPGHILVEGRRSDGSICLSVANDGQPLDATLIARVGERFLRGATDRSRETGGIGLGLAIAAEIARHHRGSLSLAYKEGGGAIATMSFQAATLS